MTIARRAVGRRIVLAVDGEIDLVSADELRAAADEALEDGAYELWLDLTATSFMDSSGIHVLVDADGKVRALRRRLAIICPPGRVRRAIEIAGLGDRLPIYPDLVAAQNDAA